MNEEVLFYSLVSTVFDISFTSGIIIFHIFLNILIMGNSSKHQRGKKTEKQRKTKEKKDALVCLPHTLTALCVYLSGNRVGRRAKEQNCYNLR